MTIQAERTIFIAADFKLYDSESATQPLPSHQILVNHGVDCKFTFIIKSDVGDTFRAVDPIVWDPSRPNHFTEATLISPTVLYFHDSNSQEKDLDTPFNLFLTQAGSVGRFLSHAGVLVDPTIVDKGDEGGFID